MKTRFSLLIAVTAALLAGTTAMASDIYTWTDKDGNVHYEDRPIANTPVERLRIVSRNTDNTAVKARARRSAQKSEVVSSVSCAHDAFIKKANPANASIWTKQQRWPPATGFKGRSRNIAAPSKSTPTTASYGYNLRANCRECPA